MVSLSRWYKKREGIMGFSDEGGVTSTILSNVRMIPQSDLVREIINHFSNDTI